ncbi:MAG: hypothetical protein K1W33_08500 [Clostridia bacterium]|nr:hypothetical protein [Clostridia bacterium]
MKKFVSILLILSLFLIILTGCSNQESVSLQDKNIAELEYVEKNIVDILNKLVREQYAVEETQEKVTNEILEDEIDLRRRPTLNWEKLLNDTKKIENSIPTILVDLTALNIEATEIAKLSDGVNNMIIAIGNEDEKTYLIELNNVYSLIPTYMEKYAGNNEKTFKKKLKYYAISTYIAYSDGNLEMAKTQSGELERVYSEKMQDMNYVQNNEYNLNKLYILIQELKRAVDSNSSELVKSKYLLIIDEI